MKTKAILEFKYGTMYMEVDDANVLSLANQLHASLVEYNPNNFLHRVAYIMANPNLFLRGVDY